MKLNIQKINPFSKNADQKRDDNGKFTAGTGGLSKLKKFNWSRAAPVIVLISLVGGFLVFRSFAGVVKPSAYQYSVVDCDQNSSKTADVTCRDESAESLAFKSYSALLNRKPDVNGYKHMVQVLAGDRYTTSKAISELVYSSELNWKGLDNTAFVKRVYEKLLGRSPTQAEINVWLPKLKDAKSKAVMIRFVAGVSKIPELEARDKVSVVDNKMYVEMLFKNLLKRGDTFVATNENSYYLKSLNSKKMTRTEVARIVITSTEASSKNHALFDAFVKTAPKVAVAQVAKQKQKYREAQAHVYAADAYNKWKIADQNLKDSQKDLNNAKSLASGSAGARANLDGIAAKQHASEAKYATAIAANTAALKSFKAADGIFKTSKEVSAHSRDIPNKEIETWRNKAAIYAADSKNKANQIKSIVGQIASNYNSFRGRYEAEQRRLEAERAAKARQDAIDAEKRRCPNGDKNGSASGCGGGVTYIYTNATPVCLTAHVVVNGSEKCTKNGLGSYQEPIWTCNSNAGWSHDPANAKGCRKPL